jgi:hypothetical protein
MHLVDSGTSPITINATITGLKFFFEVTLSRGEVLAKLHPVRVPRTLPVVLSRDEVARLIAAAPNLKHRTALAVAYGAGLRASEVIALKVGDIDSKRMTLRVEQGKGRKDRYAMLSPVLLEAAAAAGPMPGQILPSGWLFPAWIRWTPDTTFNRASKSRRGRAHHKRVSMHAAPACNSLLSRGRHPRDQVLLEHAKLDYLRPDYAPAARRTTVGRHGVGHRRCAQTLEEREQPIIGPATGLRPVSSCRLCLLHPQVGIQIDLGRLDRLMPSHSAIVERSTPSCSRSIAVVWRSTCGLTRLFFNDGHFTVAVVTCLLSR